MSGTVGPRKLRLLDFFPNAAVAYSLRKLRLNYNGSAIRVRRSVDNASQDIGFLGNDLDTTTMLDFVGYNLFLYSEDFSNAYWGKLRLNTTGTPAYVDVETAPDGTLTGDKMIEDTTGSVSSGLHGQSKTNIAYLASTDYNVSVYLKQGERTKVRIDSEIEGTYKACDLDLTNGTISNSTFTNAPIVTAEANGWYRFSVTITSLSAGSRVPLRVFMYNGANLDYLGNGTSGCYIWGFQLSQTSEVKQYQKTEATAGGDGFVSILYDQSTNGNNIAQSTVASQPQIVSSGNLIYENSKITIEYNNSYMFGSYQLADDTNFLISIVLRINSSNTTSHPRIGSFNSSANSVNLQYGYNGSNQYYVRKDNATLGTTAQTNILSNQYLLLFESVSNAITIDRNNLTLSTTTVSTPTINSSLGNGIHLFKGYTTTAGYINTGNFQELIMWPSNQSSNKSGIKSNTDTYYSIY